jgi:DNA repair protein RadC
VAETSLSDPVIGCAADVAKLLRRIALEEIEVFIAVHLDAKRRVRGLSEVSRGVLTGSLVHPREVFRLAVAFGAAGLIVAHNHPSGDTTPSAEDREVTLQLVRSGKTLAIPVLDHVIIGSDGSFSSMANLGLM